MSDYAPVTQDIRALVQYAICDQSFETDEKAGEIFDRWLVGVRAEARAEALREVTVAYEQAGSQQADIDWLRERADREGA